MSQERMTSQKKMIIDYLESVNCHPSADEVYNYVKKKLPQISKGTVYRILGNLKEKGELKEVSLDVSRYETKTCSHAHFVCDKCGRVEDIMDHFDVYDIKKNQFGDINQCRLIFNGTCKNCS